MDITVYSSVPERREFINSCASFFIERLNLQKSKYSLLIMCKQGLRTKSGPIGLAAKLSKNEIVVIIDNKLSIEKFLLTLAHEMVHVKQIAKGQYTSDYTRYGNIRQYWCGKKTKAKYLDRPWEIEAYRRESILVNELLDRMSKNKKRC